MVRCPDLLHPQEDGREARKFAAVVAVMETFSPLVDVVRPGVAALAVRGPSRYFGGDASLARRLTSALRTAIGSEQTGHTVTTGIGVADGLFAAVLAASAVSENPTATVPREGGPLVVPPGGTAAFLAPWSVAVLDRPELVDLLIRLGIGTLGRFAALPSRHVLSRFGADGDSCHRVARGIVGDLPGLRLPAVALSTRSEPTGAPTVRQPGFWGGSAAADRRAADSFLRVEQMIGPGAVRAGRIQGGRSPVERARLVPWDGRAAPAGPRTTGPDDPRRARRGPIPPWPGQLPPPAPALVFAPPVPAQVADAGGRRVGVDGRGAASCTARPPVRRRRTNAR